MSIEQDLIAEGEPEREFNPGIAGRMPKKVVAGGALIRDLAGRILFVEPTYKPMLDIPGGVADANESPHQATQRELTEELGLTLTVGRTLVVDWCPGHGVWSDSIQFVYDGGVLTPEEFSTVRIPEAELASVKFLTLGEAESQLRPSQARRIERALQALSDGGTYYLEFGRSSE